MANTEIDITTLNFYKIILIEPIMIYTLEVTNAMRFLSGKAMYVTIIVRECMKSCCISKKITIKDLS